MNYEPNSFGGPSEDSSVKEEAYNFEIDGIAARYNHREGNDDYTQAGVLFSLLAPDHQERLIDNLADSMQTVPHEIQLRQIMHFVRADRRYGEGVARALGVDLSEIDEIAETKGIEAAPTA